eukprot:GHVU01129125.1.p3 GENE.GHVU01129125.1~~GHVU01129125.1.p3  ORF type:complete len:127 (+),score=4.47 GHVU01129125.1:591-971(+)
MGRSMEEAHTYGQYRGRLAAVCCRLCTVFGLSPLLAFLRLRFFRVLRFESVRETRGFGVPLFHVTLNRQRKIREGALFVLKFFRFAFILSKGLLGNPRSLLLEPQVRSGLLEVLWGASEGETPPQR